MGHFSSRALNSLGFCCRWEFVAATLLAYEYDWQLRTNVGERLDVRVDTDRADSRHDVLQRVPGTIAE